MLSHASSTRCDTLYTQFEKSAVAGELRTHMGTKGNSNLQSALLAIDCRLNEKILCKHVRHYVD